MSTVHLHGEEVDVVVIGVKGFLGFPSLKAPLSTQRRTTRFGRVPRNKLPYMCDMAPCRWSTLCSEGETISIWSYPYKMP